MDPFTLLLALLLFLLIIWGLGAPIPEESVLLLAAVIAQYGHFWGIVWTCTFGIAVADTLVYVRGRARSRVFTPFATGKRFIASAGAFAILTSRVLISVRAVVPFMAGALRMPRWRFHSASLFGAFISSTIVIGVGHWLYAFLPTAYAALIWTVLIMLVTGILVMYATRAQAHLLRTAEREEAADANAGAVHTPAGYVKQAKKQANHAKSR